jgi:trans-aconitate 2-methyltransferase
MIQWNPEDYQNNSSHLEKWAFEVLSKLSLQGDEKLLDIGSGDGKVTAAISKLLPYGSVVGIDSSIEMIEFSRSKYNKIDYPKLKFILMDMREIHFEKEFDIVFSTATFHWVTDYLKVLQQIKKCLRTPGRIILQMGGVGNQAALLQTLDDVINKTTWRIYLKDYLFQYGYYSKEDYQAWLKEAGFIEQRIDMITKDNPLKGKEGLCKWVRLAFSPYVQRIPAEI